MTDPEAVDDVVAITPTTLVKVAAACTTFGGVLSLVLALQAGALLEVRGAFRAVVVVFAVLGVAAVVCGFRVSRMRRGAALWAAIVMALLCLAAIGWFVLALLGGVFVLLALALVPITAVGTVSAARSIKTVERAALARSRLRSLGLDVGL